MTIFQTTHKSEECEPDTHVVLADPTRIELHLSGNTEFPRCFGAQVKAAGGTYSSVRGNRLDRSVIVPLTPDTLVLINALVQTYGSHKTTMIGRGTALYGAPAWVTVHNVSREEPEPVTTFLNLYWQAVQQAMDRGMCNLHEGEPPVADPLVYAKRRLERATHLVALARTALREQEAGEQEAADEVRRLESLATR